MNDKDLRRVGKAERELFKKLCKKTHADRIRAKTDEELAEFLAEYRCTHKAPHCMEANCAQCWLEWLRQEAEEGAGTT